MSKILKAISSTQDQRSSADDGRNVTVARLHDAESIIDPTGALRRACRPGPATAQRFARGFTLIELMMVLAVVGVLSSVAYPSFMGQLQKIRRADAMLSILQVQAAQERWRASNPAYGTLAEIGIGGTSGSGHYTLLITQQSARGYEIQAAATGSQANDTNCRSLRLRAEGGNVAQTSGADAATNNASQQNRQCWIV